MIILMLVNTDKKIAYAKKFFKQVDALNYVRKIAHIPPQTRVIYVMDARCTEYWCESGTLHQITSYINNMLPPYKVFQRFQEYPVYMKKE